jgi:hypothetical protein
VNRSILASLALLALSACGAGEQYGVARISYKETMDASGKTVGCELNYQSGREVDKFRAEINPCGRQFKMAGEAVRGFQGQQISADLQTKLNEMYLRETSALRQDLIKAIGAIRSGAPIPEPTTPDFPPPEPTPVDPMPPVAPMPEDGGLILLPP